MSQYHEPVEDLSDNTKDFVRALNSLKEEIEAVNWYQQRVDAATSQPLKEILAHNRDEEIEHACMTIEWLRRNMPAWDDELRTYLFTNNPITQLEDEKEENGEDGNDGDNNNSGGDLGIGSLKNK